MEMVVNQLNWYLYLAFFHFQVHLIARVNNVSKVYIADIWLHPPFNFVLVTKLCCSKNVMDEWDCLDQIILGTKDWQYCVLVGLAIHHKMPWLALGSSMQCSFVFGVHGTEDTNATKENVASYLTNCVFGNWQFVKITQGPLGTHCLQKFAQHKLNKVDEFKMKQNWRTMETEYKNSWYVYWSQNPSCWCKSSCCFVLRWALQVCSQTGLWHFWGLDSWPHSPQHFPLLPPCSGSNARKSTHLGCVFLMHPTHLSDGLCAHVRAAYKHIPNWQSTSNTENPVGKIELFITHRKGDIFIDELDSGEDDIQTMKKARLLTNGLSNDNNSNISSIKKNSVHFTHNLPICIETIMFWKCKLSTFTIDRSGSCLQSTKMCTGWWFSQYMLSSQWPW